MKLYEARIKFYADNFSHAMYITKFIEVIELELSEVKENGENEARYFKSVKKE